MISVIIPSYNHSQYIKEAVESVFSQTYENLELIVIDDGSSDNSLTYLRSISDPRFTLIEQTNQGAHAAINAGLSESKGDYLTILNSDDVFHPERLARCINKINAGADLVTSWIEVINENGKKIGIKEGWRNMLPWNIKYDTQYFEAEDQFALNLILSNFVSTTSNILFTRKLYKEIGGFKSYKFAHDWDFLLRCALRFKCELIYEPLLNYRIHDNNTIKSDRKGMLFEILLIYAVHLKNYSKFYGSKKNDYFIGLVHDGLNFQGNEKVFIALSEFVYANDQRLDLEQQLLENKELKNSFIDLISENSG